MNYPKLPSFRLDGKRALVTGAGRGIGMGASIALACDMRVASTKGFITTAYVDIGLTGDYGGTYTLTELVGPAKAKELAFTNTRVYGEEG